MKDIIFYHITQTDLYASKVDYFQYIVATAKKYNPTARIHILCDSIEIGRNTGAIQAYVHAYDSPEIDLFKSIYIHSGNNTHGFEINCILRWFYIYNYCKKNNIRSFVHLDSDTMLFKDISTIEFTHAVETNIVYDYINCPEVVSDIICPHCHFINDIDMLEKFTALCINSYQDRGSDLFKIETELKRWGVKWGLSDMFIWGLLCKQNRESFKNIKGVKRDESIYCTAIEDLEGMASEEGVKQIVKIGSDFYGWFFGDKIKYNCIHWHGGHKSRVKEFYEKYIK